ncbi:A-kinase anchor protein, putative [Pediculus humanus corporis]|uniref:A-kinase anchor protein, putative n=1 Tax=Pediculus humanus subsp. corporis TaxID=121224 RepID=E0VTZ6_PEDHC|nr:A-kinase anchor protein, putative [Pediculus humanus corporis]EEB16852.1 A-kinase anchor protein, putative [Pediculus humanus corporis]
MAESNQTMLERSMRSVFVGNIPFDLTEEKLKEIFSEVGPVLSFKLVYDRENGKPKGYGFCEYKDIETANSAMRNLNGFEIGGRVLKVDNAANEKTRMEMQNMIQANEPIQNSDNNFEHVEAEKVPEAISKAVASLPPEQMFELMKQMKQCIQNNPSEARTMLLQNPQLAYALLQAQVVMGIVDPHVAVNMLHKANVVPEINLPVDSKGPQPPVVRPEFASQAQHNTGKLFAVERPVDPRVARSSNADTDLRIPFTAPVPVPAPHPVMPPIQNQHFAPAPDMILRDPRQAGVPVPMPVAPPRDPRAAANLDPRTPAVDPRSGVSINTPTPPPRQPAPVPVPNPSGTISQRPTPGGMPPNALSNAVSDQEKAALIMQVLQLSDEQIAMLPPEQRQSILVLKEQIAKSTQR